MHVALFGGSFNPPHVAHQMVALYVLETAPIDQLWFVPCWSTPSTSRSRRSTTGWRMCELAATALGSRVRVTEIERDDRRSEPHCGPSCACRPSCPAHNYSLVIGSDLVDEVPSWYAGEELQRTVPFIVVGRPAIDAAG